jgi:RNA polymerase sigma-70 factor (ECF subfamily)
MIRTDESQADSFDRGVVAHIGLVRHIGAATLSGHYDLDDFTQDVLARAFAKRDQLRDPSRLRAWLASIARNTARNRNRNRRFAFAELSDALSLPVPSADEWLSERERWAALVDALSRLPESDQALIRAYYYDEVSAREIEALTRLSAGAIRVRLSRARAVLRERLAPLLAVLGYVDRAQTPRGFGEVPKGDNRMGMTGSLACSLVVVGWLGFGAYQVEQETRDAATFPAQGDAPAPTAVFAAELRPAASPTAADDRDDSSRPVSPVSEEAQSMSKVLEVVPTRTISTVVGTLHTTLQGLGQSEWSMDRLYGVLGHAFTFEMAPGGGDVWQEARLDYASRPGFFEMLPGLGLRFQRFDAVQRDEEGDFQRLKVDAWEAVRKSIDRGVPAIAWQPMSREQKAEGLRAGGWGMLVGYDESDETYTVRHQYHRRGRDAYTVRYDAIGHSDPSEWFCVLVLHHGSSANALVPRRVLVQPTGG